jgi:DNA-binding NtrC family response regulator
MSTPMSVEHHERSLDAQLMRALTPPPPRLDPLPSVSIEPGMTIDAVNRALLVLTLHHTKGHRIHTAAMLGISPKTLYNWLQRFGLEGS